MKIIVIVVAIILINVFGASEKPYTHEEWDEECIKMLKKYGPVPEDEE
ncbi:hypothetical protein [Tenacibaculum sp. C7A-26P2]